MDDREEALVEMHKAALRLIRLIELEKGNAGGSLNRWHIIERALVDIRDAWEGAKACEISADEPD
jgi:hypothetical protein